jgi:hypothetical protein
MRPSNFRILLLLLLWIGLPVMSLFASETEPNVSVESVMICRDGATFFGQAMTAAALDSSMTGQIFNEGGELVATGNGVVFIHLHELRGFTITYPADTFKVGETVRFAISDILGSPDGTLGISERGTVADCHLPTRFVALDKRINRYDVAAPIAVYPINDDSFHIYTLDANGNGSLTMIVSEEAIEAAGRPLLDVTIAEDTEQVVIRQATGQFRVEAPMPNGKHYVLIFDEISETTPYTSYEIEN